MASIISTHKDSGFASACQNELQIEVVRFDSEPNAEQLEQYPNAEWSAASSGSVVFDNYKGRYDDKPIRSVPMQTSGVDKFIMVISVLGGLFACVIFLGLR